MTETTAVTTSPEVPAVDPNKGVDEFGMMAKARTTGLIEQYNALASRVKAAEGNPQALLDNLRENYTEDEQVVKITHAIEELDNKREALWTKRDAILKPVVDRMVEESKAGLGDTETEAAALLKVVKSGIDYIKATYGDHAITDMPHVAGKRGGRTGGTSGGTGARRVRGFDVYVDGTLATSKDAQGNDKSNLAAAAKVLGVDTEDLRVAFFTAAGSDDSKAWPNTVTFEVTVNVEGSQVVKHVVAKRTVHAAKGAPAVSEAPNQDSQTAQAS